MPNLELSGLPDIVDGEENLIRFITQSNHVSGTKPKAGAFLPNPRDWTKSVIRHEPIPEQLPQLKAEFLPNQNVHCAAVVQAKFVREATLDVVAAEPPPFHANIVGWEIMEDPVLQKARHTRLALLIASKATILPMA